MGGLSRVWVGLIGLRVKTGHRSIRVIFKLVNRVMGQTGCRSNGSGQTGLTHFVMSTLLFNTLTLVDPCTAFLKKLARLTKFTLIIYIYIFRIIIIYINSNIAALVQYYSSKGKLNANNNFFFFFFFFFFFSQQLVVILYLFIIILLCCHNFFSLSFLATWLPQIFFFPSHFWQLIFSNLVATNPIILPYNFGNLVATILFSLSSLPLNFNNLVGTIGFFLPNTSPSDPSSIWAVEFEQKKFQ